MRALVLALFPALALAQGVTPPAPAVLRATVTVDLPQIITNACSHTHVPVTGATVGSECVAAHPAGFPDQTFTNCHVDEPGTVDLHVCNLGTPYDPASATFSVRVFLQ